MFKAITGLLSLGIVSVIAAAQNPAPQLVAPEPAPAISAQTMLSVKWEELTTEDFLKAITLAKNTCVLPLGVVETRSYRSSGNGSTQCPPRYRNCCAP